MQSFNVKLLYAYKFIGQCLPIYALYTILFIERGQSVTDIAVLCALWSTFSIVFEVPSGILADRWSRRNLLAISAVLQGLCFVIWSFSHAFFLFALGFVCWALSGAFASGTEEGLIYDNLKSDGREEQFTAVYGRAHFFANAGTCVGIATAGVLGSFISISVIALLSASICFARVLLVLRMREKNYYAERPCDTDGGFFATFKEAGSFLKGSASVLISILFLMLFASLGSALDEFDALIIYDLGLGNIWVSVIVAARFAFVALGDVLAPVVQKRISTLKQIFLLVALAYVFLILFSIVWSQYAILIFWAAFMFMAVAEILLVNALQKGIREEGRATVMSFYGAGQNIIMICFSLVYALLAAVFTLQQVYILLSAYGIIGSLIFFLLPRTALPPHIDNTNAP